MSWVRYDDELNINKKIVALKAEGITGFAALGLHLMLNAYARHNGLGGQIAKREVPVIAGKSDANKLARLLCAVGMLDDNGDCWGIHDGDEYGAPDDPAGDVSAAEKRRQISMKRAEAGRQGGLAKAGKRVANAKQDTLQTSTPVPVPVPERTPPPTQLQAEPDSRLGGGGLPTWRNTVALTAANMLADKERPGTIANRAGWTFKVAQRLLAEHAGWIDHTPYGTAETAAEGLLAHIYASNAPKPTSDDEYSKAGAGYGRAVAQAQVEGDMVDRDSFLGEIDGRPEAWKAAATVAYDEALSALPPFRRHDAPSEATSAVLRLVGRQS